MLLRSMGQPTFPFGVSSIAIRACPRGSLEDAAAEAWVAVLEGRSPNAAVSSFARRERKHAERFRPMTDVIDDELVPCFA